MKWRAIAAALIGVWGVENASAQTNKQPTMAEMEREYLDGKITAREFQRFLQTYRPEPARAQPKTALSTNEVQQRALEVLRKTAPNVAANPKGPAISEPLPEPPRPEQTNEAARAAALDDVESKLDRLIRLKEARESTAVTTNAASTNTSPVGATSPKTKRERLDELLRLNIQGKLSDAEYNDRRAKILAEPD